MAETVKDFFAVVGVVSTLVIVGMAFVGFMLSRAK